MLCTLPIHLPRSRTRPPSIVAVIDWDFGGSQALPLADNLFEVISSPEDPVEAEEQDRWQMLIEDRIGRLPVDYGLAQMWRGMMLLLLERDEQQRVLEAE